MLGSAILDAALREDLGIPDGYAVEAPVAFGYPESIPPIPERKAPSILKVIE